MSRIAAKTMHQAAQRKSPRAAETIAKMPKKRFPSVNAEGG
jgi:hypothetical protein